jgi:hypothetical protein
MYLILNDKGAFHAYSITEEQLTDYEDKVATVDDAPVGHTITEASDLESLTTADLIGVYNTFAEKPLVKFKSKTSGAERTFAALLEHAPAWAAVVDVDTVPVGKPSSERRTRSPKGTLERDPKPKEQIRACRADTCQAALIDALNRRNGATLLELCEVVPNWAESTVYGSGLSYDVCTVKGYGITTSRMTPRQAYDDGHEASAQPYLGTDQEHEPIISVFFLVLPDGMVEPLSHIERKTPKKTVAE